MKATVVLLFLVAVIVLVAHSATGHRVVCYFVHNAWYRAEGALFPEDVDPSLCTHINYAFALLDPDSLTLASANKSTDIVKKFYTRVTGLKYWNSKLKVLLSLGGWGANGSDYSKLVGDPKKRRNFIEKAIPFLKKYGFDGLDLDWEYPSCWQGNCADSPASDKENFAKWIEELREAFDRQNPPLLLTAAVKSQGIIVDRSYDVPSISKNLDFINLMTYDFHGYPESRTGHHAQRSKRKGDDDEDFNMVDSAMYWTNRSAPSNRIVIGLPSYGRSFQLSNPSESGLKAEVKGPGPGTLGYSEICTRLKYNGWQKDRDLDVGPWATKDDLWVGYDDPYDAFIKAHWVISNGFGGVMVWDLSTDDIKGQCCNFNFPFIRAMHDGIFGKGLPPPDYGCP